MTRIAVPMVGGMVTAPLPSMLFVPAAWYLQGLLRVRQRGQQAFEAREPVDLPTAAA